MNHTPCRALRRRGLLAWAGLAALAPAGDLRADDAKKPAHYAPDTPLGRTFDGKPLTLADVAGPPTVVMFWAAWCPHCRKELNALDRLQTAAGEQRVRIVAVNTEDRKAFRDVHRVLADKTKLTLTYDPDEGARKAFAAPTSVPYTVLLRADGSVIQRQSGWSDERLNDFIELLNEALRSGAKPPR